MCAFALLIALPTNFIMGYTTSIHAYNACYVILYGTYIGLTYMLPVYNTWEFFPKHQGLTSGLIIGSYGIGAIIYQQIAISVCNPNNIPAVDGIYPPEVADNVPRLQKVNCWVNVLFFTLVITCIFQGPKKGSPERIDESDIYAGTNILDDEPGDKTDNLNKTESPTETV